MNDLKIFCAFLDEARADLLQVRRTHLDVFSRVHEKYTDSNASVARRLAAISAFYRFLLLDEVIDKSPADYIRRPPVDPDFTATQALTQREALRLLDTATEHSLRAQTLVDLLLSTGLRISEALNMRESDISQGRLLITRKGGKKSAVYLPEHTLRNLRDLTRATGLEAETQENGGVSYYICSLYPVQAADATFLCTDSPGDSPGPENDYNGVAYKRK
ncbi:tyrosine-type recombinase/integrase [Rothia terrae]|uniref:tyrosine-type recombinase/integrase n=1 Tax=Rothia terrae TaxID=396015 RepID=UPI0028815408|nr:tyrosine-type recombinase/integrase [Rothia terrae]MDT0189527.1 tyrosine-type recombinase/integrase [Rothia terrae]